MHRSDLETMLVELISGVPAHAMDADSILARFACDKQVEAAMNAVDEYVATLKGTTPRNVEAWDARQVAEYHGYADENAARAMLSRKGIEPVRKVVNPDTGRKKSLYPASAVRAMPTMNDVRK